MSKVVNGLVVHEYGDALNPPIIFLHGFPYNYRMWMSQLNCLRPQYHCVAYDIRGLGESDPGDGQYTMEGFVDDLEAVISELNLKNPVICGFSMGGYITLRAVMRNPQLYKAMILINTRATADSNEARLKRAVGIRQINEENVNVFVEGFVPNCFLPEYVKERSRMYVDMLAEARKSKSKGVKGCLLAMAGRLDLSQALKEMRLPSLVLAGKSDPLVPVAEMQAMAAALPLGKFVEVHSAAHMSPVENSGFVNQELTKFLNSLFG